MIPSDDHDLLDPIGPDPMAPGQRKPDRLSGIAVGLVGLLAAVAVAAVALFALGGDDETAGSSDDQAALADDADTDATTDADAGLGSSAGDDGDPADGTDPAGATAAGPTTTGTGAAADTASSGQDDPAGTPTSGQDGSANGSPTSGGGTTTTIDATSDTAEADETTEDPDDSDPTADPNGDPNAGGTPGPTQTASTLPPPTTGTCQIAAAEFDGRAGVVDLGTDGACGALSATIQAVNPRDDQAASDWGRDIRVCQRHPAAGEVEIGIRTGSETIDLTQGWSRSAEEAAADPIQSITVRFSNQATPETGPRPVALCRTDGAELSIVHRPAG